MTTHLFTNQSLSKLNSYLLSILIILIPFHAAFVTIVGSQIGQSKLYLQSWKEIIILLIVGLSFLVYLKDRKKIKYDLVNILVVMILGFSIIVSYFAKTNTTVFLVGVKTNLLVLSLYLAVQTFSHYFSTNQIKKLVIFPALVVGLIAILQPYIPINFLSNIGYNSTSIIPAQFVENFGSNAIRVFSTLGGPNQLGAYLIIPLGFCLGFALKKRQWYWWLGYVLFSICLYMTFSRSAWLGAIVTTVVMVVITLPKKIQIILVALVFSIIIFAMLFINQKNICTLVSNKFTQSLLHGDCSSGKVGGSDLIRLKSLRNGISTATNKPLGYGIGSAGPASFYSQTPQITENWYLQLAIEIGVFGLLLYLVFFAISIYNLYRCSQSNLHSAVFCNVLLGCLAGVLTTGLFLHSLADSTLAILMFSLLGLQKGGIKA